jgi:hypothetical protein
MWTVLIRDESTELQNMLNLFSDKLFDIWYILLKLNMKPAAILEISCELSYGLVSFTEFL